MSFNNNNKKMITPQQQQATTTIFQPTRKSIQPMTTPKNMQATSKKIICLKLDFISSFKIHYQ